MERVLSAVGIVVLLGIGWAFSTDRKAIPWRVVVAGIALQVYMALFIVRTDWVPVLLPAFAGLCFGVLVVSWFRALPGLLVSLARGLGVLGACTAIIHGALINEIPVACLLAVFPLLAGLVTMAAGERAGRQYATGWALAGCLAMTIAISHARLPEDFVYQGIAGIGTAVGWVIGISGEAARQIFGGLPDQGGFVFAIEVGAIILVFGGLLSVLYHIGIIPWIVGLLARVLHKALGVSGAESLAAASNVFVGQTEAPLVIRPYLATMTRSELMALMTGGFATIAGSVLGAYVKFLTEAGFDRGAADLIAASVMSAPAAFVFAKLFVPEAEEAVTRDGVDLPREKLGTNVLDALAGGVTASMKLAVNVMAMLLVFYALIFMLDKGVVFVAGLFGHEGMKFADLYAHLFRPFAFLIGVPWDESLSVGQLLGTKTLFNEFIAYTELADMIKAQDISPRSAVLSTYALCGFANFMSIGIQIGGLSGLAPGRRADFSKLALRAMIAGALACQLTACIVGVLGNFPEKY